MDHKGSGKKYNSSGDEDAVKINFTIDKTINKIIEELSDFNTKELLSYSPMLEINLHAQLNTIQPILRFVRFKKEELNLYLCGKPKTVKSQLSHNESENKDNNCPDNNKE